MSVRAALPNRRVTQPRRRDRAPIATWGALLATLVGSCALVAPFAAPAAAMAAAPRTSLPVIERQVMCVTCKIPLNVAQSPQADRERAFIQGLIDQGDGEGEIKHALVGQYGPTVLGLPGAHGFDLTAYLVPIAVVAALLALAIVLLPRWRARAAAQSSREHAPEPLGAEDAQRLEADLARFD